MIGAKCSSNFEGSSSLLDMINKTRNDRDDVAFKEMKIHTPFEVHAVMPCLNSGTRMVRLMRFNATLDRGIKLKISGYMYSYELV